MRYLFLLMALFAFGRVQAQMAMSFDQAMSMMLDNNTALSGARLGVSIAEDEVRMARGLRFPRVDLIGGYVLMQHNVDVDLGGAKGVVTKSIESLISSGVSSGLITNDIASLIGGALSPLTSADWRYTLQKRSFGVVGATLTIPIYSGGKINVANRAARIKQDISNYELSAIENALVTELVERYYGVALAQSVVALRREVLNGVDKHLRDAEAMEQEGVLPHSAILYLQYRMSEAEKDLRDAESQLTVTRRALMTTIGTTEEVITTRKMFVCDSIHDLDYYIDAANNLNPILLSAITNVKLAKEGVKLSRSELLPEVVAMGGASLYSYNLSDMVPRWTVGVGVSMKLFDGLAKEYGYSVARRNEQRVAALVENGVSEIELLVEKEYYAVINSIAAIESCRRSKEFAESYLFSTSEGFREGVVSSSDLVDARVEYAAASVEYLNAAYDFIVSLSRLLEASGLSSDFVSYRGYGREIDI